MVRLKDSEAILTTHRTTPTCGDLIEYDVTKLTPSFRRLSHKILNHELNRVVLLQGRGKLLVV